MTTLLNSNPYQMTDLIDDLQLTRLARLSGALPDNHALTPQLKEFAMMVMEKCAAVADPFIDDHHDHCAGDQIRAKFGLL